jgi:hypothetical protein
MVVNEITTYQDRIQGAIQIEGGWKFLINADNAQDGDQNYELYNILEDPNETTDLSDIFPDILEDMKVLFENLRQQGVPIDRPNAVGTELIQDENGNLITGWC